MAEDSGELERAAKLAELEEEAERLDAERKRLEDERKIEAAQRVVEEKKRALAEEKNKAKDVELEPDGVSFATPPSAVMADKITENADGTFSVDDRTFKQRKSAEDFLEYYGGGKTKTQDEKPITSANAAMAEEKKPTAPSKAEFADEITENADGTFSVGDRTFKQRKSAEDFLELYGGGLVKTKTQNEKPATSEKKFTENLGNLKKMRDDGTLTEDEFKKAKQKLLELTPSNIGRRRSKGIDRGFFGCLQRFILIVIALVLFILIIWYSLVIGFWGKIFGVIYL